MKRLLSCSVILLAVSGSTSAQTPNNARMLSTPNEQTGTSYTFVPADTTRVTTFNNASPVAATLPNGATVGFGPGNMLSVVNKGAGAVTLTCTSCTINANGVAAATLVLSQGQGADIYGGIGNPAVNYVALPSPSGTFSNITASSLTVSGTGTFTNINTILYVCNATYACTDAGLQAAQNTLTTGGTIVVPPSGSLTISNTVNITNNRITIMGVGPGSNIQVANLGDAFNVTADHFRLQNLNVGITATGTRTGAIIHASSSAAVLGSAQNIDVNWNASATNNGFFFLADAANVTNWSFRDIIAPRTGTTTAAFKFVNSSGVATMSTFRIQGFIGGSSFTDAGIVVDGAVDTLQVQQSIFNNDINGGKAVHVRNTVGGFINPRFIFFDQVSLEAIDSGTHTSVCLQVDAGRQVHYTNGYCATATNDFIIGASAIDTIIDSNTSATTQQSFATVASGAVRTIISNNTIQDVSQQTTNTFDVMSIAANATDINIHDNFVGCTNPSFQPRYFTNIAAGTGDRIRVTNNNIPASGCTGTAVVTNGASGADVLLSGNVQLANNFPIKLGESGPPATFANQDVCYGDSTAHALKCSFNNGAFGIISTATLTLKTGSGGGAYTGTNTALAAVDTTNLCTVITVPTGWKLFVSASGVGQQNTAAAGVSIALADAGATCTSGGIVALAGSQRDFVPPAITTNDQPFQTQYVLTGDGNPHSIALMAKTANAADAWVIVNSSAVSAPSMVFQLMPSN